MRFTETFLIALGYCYDCREVIGPTHASDVGYELCEDHWEHVTMIVDEWEHTETFTEQPTHIRV